MAETKKSILVWYRVPDYDDDEKHNDKSAPEVAIFNEKMSAAFRDMLNVAPVFKPDTLKDDYYQLLTGPNVRSPETGLTALKHFKAIANKDYDLLRSTCINDLVWACEKHDIVGKTLEEYIDHLTLGQSQTKEIKFAFPGLVSIGTQFAMIHYEYHFKTFGTPVEVGYKSGKHIKWAQFAFNKERLITRISHPDSVTARVSETVKHFTA